MTYDNDFGTTGGRMDTVGGTSLSAMFDSHDDAQRAVDRLVQAGIPMAQVRMVSGGSASTTTTSTTDGARRAASDEPNARVKLLSSR